MTSKQEPLRIHVALFPSIMALKKSGAGKCQVTRIKGQYSKVLQKDSAPTQGRVFKDIYTSFQKMARVDWTNEKDGKPITIDEIAEEARLNNIPDVIIEKITILRNWTEFSNYTMQNETFTLPWNFEPYTFRKGIWKRLKAIDFPAKRLYEEYSIQKREVLENMNETTRKRWRDTILMNAPQKTLTNQEIRAMWQGEKYSLLLKEARGNFDLMDIGEWR